MLGSRKKDFFTTLTCSFLARRCMHSVVESVHCAARFSISSGWVPCKKHGAPCSTPLFPSERAHGTFLSHPPSPTAPGSPRPPPILLSRSLSYPLAPCAQASLLPSVYQHSAVWASTVLEVVSSRNVSQVIQTWKKTTTQTANVCPSVCLTDIP